MDNTLPAGANTTSYNYDLVGNLASVTEPNGVVTTYSYNKLNRLTDEVVKNANGTVLASYSYTLDNAGNRTGVTETQLLPNGTVNTRTVAYQYDNLYRLLSETISGDSQGGNGVITYTYSLTGNRMSRTSSVAGVATVTDTYNANDELTSETSGGVTTSYSYDANGNTIESVTGNQSPVTFAYDSQNHLVKQDAGQSNEIDIVYDGQGNKASETVGGVTTIYLVDTNNPTGYSQIAEEIVNGAVTRRYTLGHWIISETQNISGTWTTSFYGYDGHNSVRFLTNSAGTVTDNYTLDAFGIEIVHSGTTPNQILYSGEYLDPGTGDYDLRARVYNENTGTFLTRDTYAGQNGDPITLHQYLYAGADPVMNVDLTGDYTQSFGYAAEAAIRGVYVANHPGDRIGTGGWTRFGPEDGSSYRLKTDILNRTTLQFAEIKPFSLSGIMDGIAQFAKYTFRLGPLGYTPDVNWIPIPPITTVSGKPLFFANFEGLVLYTNADEALRLMLTISVLGASGQFLSDNAQFLRNLLGQAGGSPELVNAAEAAPTLSLETDVMTATLIEEI